MNRVFQHLGYCRLFSDRLQFKATRSTISPKIPPFRFPPPLVVSPSLTSQSSAPVHRDRGQFLQMITCRDKKSSWRLLAAEFRKIMQADICVFLLVPVEDPTTVKLSHIFPENFPICIESKECNALLEFLQKHESDTWSFGF